MNDQVITFDGRDAVRRDAEKVHQKSQTLIKSVTRLTDTTAERVPKLALQTAREIFNKELLFHVFRRLDRADTRPASKIYTTRTFFPSRRKRK